ncbi:MAG: hypothetical protein IT433_05770 [Phycisphaerales bacterium]|nr:hypothetical protein [Phycisphaerales bacterium]
MSHSAQHPVCIAVLAGQDHALAARAKSQAEAQSVHTPCEVRVVSGTEPVSALLSVAAASRCEYFLWMDDRDELAPHALRVLLNDLPSDAVGSAGSWVGWCPLGVVPGNRVEGLGEVLDLAALCAADWIPPVAMLTRRAAVATALASTPAREAWWYRLQLGLAASGAWWRVRPESIAAFTLRPQAPEPATGLMVRAAAALANGATEAAVASWIDGLVAERLARGWLRASGRAVLETQTRHPELFGRWWSRLGFCGAPPRHVLQTQGGLVHAASRAHALRAGLIAGMAEPGRDVVLWGLGRNAAHVAAALDAKQVPWVGVDDALHGEPAWASGRPTPVDRVDAGTALRPEPMHVITPDNDAGLVERLNGLNPIRWTQTPGLLVDSERQRAFRDARAWFRPQAVTSAPRAEPVV